MISPRDYAEQTAGASPSRRWPARAAWRRWESLEGFLWVAPAFLYLALFIAYPFVMSLYLSLSSARVGSPEWHYVGLTNFRRIFEDPTFWQTVRNSFIFTFGSEAIRLIIGLPLAFAMNRTFKGKRIVQGVILIPFVIPIALSSLAWKWMFDSLYSVINWMLMTLHIIDYPWQWLGEPGLAMWAVIILNVWRGFPFSAVILLAGLTAVPVEVIEAAKIDGAGPLRRFIYVVAPIVRPILFVGLLYSIVFSFTDFSAVDPEVADAPIVRKRIDNAKLETVMSNSFGFGGTNASLVFQRHTA